MHYFHRDHNAPCPQIFTSPWFPTSPGYYSRPNFFLFLRWWGGGGGGNKVRYGLVENGQWSNYIFKRPSTEQQNSYFLHFTYFEQDAGKILSSFKPG